ncbi:ABC transporter G family member 11-like protein [Cinnamomum micranthum f. kanehirae]|uniref:ABC transporter G family member 11-like protein n=1 Tax=Cinnamomum micranthum f. kanehirae TaxID=337451 RepID=A0A3S3NFI8_9MAGN|nr:ABC transporter G family member 11-like protein [Cinnamomum micranthum f. kanehirae]
MSEILVLIGLHLCLPKAQQAQELMLDCFNFQARGSMLMFVAAFLTFMAIGGFPSFVEDMKYSRERLRAHMAFAAFVVGTHFASIALTWLLISVVPEPCYYLVGLQRGIDAFVLRLVLFVCMM